ncbi:DUF3857 domain-containing protein [Flavicella sediminum]|uniref:DUF3857 domain-containing protein n=1 Tax=Flavicella sediminum TaxID=2585141 RepID=UPI00111F0066|nr:DUF3857 domain-containing protein [Flavicella sediminum]
MKIKKNKPALFAMLALLLLTTQYNYAQKAFNSSELRVSENDLNNSFYAKDSTANALVIYEYGDSYVEGADYNIVTHYAKKIKIFNRKAFDKGTVEVYLYRNDSSHEEIDDIEATTYTKVNGKVEITHLTSENIYKEKYNDRLNLVKFTLPNLKEGSVITYRYSLKSPFIFNFKEWTFQEDIPKLYSEYNTKIPANYIYNIKLVGEKKLDTNTAELERDCLTHGTASASCAKTLYIMKDIPAFIEEDYMTSKKNYLSKIEYELISTEWFDGTKRDYTKSWKTVDREIKRDESVGKELRKKNISEKLLIPLVLTANTPLEKAKEIFLYVQQNYSWNKENRVFTQISLKKLIKEQSGSVTDLNVLLRNLLKENGLDANLVLISTRENGLPTKIFPVISEFNYSIVELLIEDQKYLLDATDPYLTFGQLPFRSLNQYGRKLDFKNDSDWTAIAAHETSKSQISIQLNLNENQELVGQMNTRYSGYHGLTKKKAYFSNKEQYLNKYKDQLHGFSAKEHIVKTEKITDTYFTETVKISKKINENNQDKFYFDPFLLKLFTENPFKLQERTYPVDFGFKDAYSYSITMDLGDSYEIVEIPKNIRLTLPEKKASIYMSSTVLGSKVRTTFTLNFKESFYPSIFYSGLKKIMSEVVHAQTKSLIVLQKKK